MSGSLTLTQLERIEQLEAFARRHGRLSHEDAAELVALKDAARAITGPAEVADDPRTLFVDESRRPLIHGIDDPATAEDESDYLGAQLSRSAREREAAALKYLKRALTLLEPIAMAALHGLIQRGVSEATKQLPAQLQPVLSVVEAAAMDAARVAAGDITPR